MGLWGSESQKQQYIGTLAWAWLPLSELKVEDALTQHERLFTPNLVRVQVTLSNTQTIFCLTLFLHFNLTTSFCMPAAAHLPVVSFYM